MLYHFAKVVQWNDFMNRQITVFSTNITDLVLFLFRCAINCIFF